MSTAGIYNYHPKVAHPNAILPQMTSEGFQPPFFLGGSQVPVNLGIPTGSGIHTPYVSHVVHSKQMSAEKRGTGLTVHKNHKIYLPKHMK
jgi:hypothetical protein